MILGNRYRYWRTDSKYCEPEIVKAEEWPHEPKPSGWIFLRLEARGSGEGEAIQQEKFFKKRHQLLRAAA